MDTNLLKESLNNNDKDEAAKLIADLYIRKPDNFKKSILLSNSLSEPLERDFNDQKLDAILGAFNAANERLNYESFDTSDFVQQCLQIYQTIKIIHKNSKSNLDRLSKNEFSKYSLSEQLQMFCIFIEDQNRLSQEETIKTKKNKFFTGMEREVARFPIYEMENIKISQADNFEALIEIANTLFRLLYYRSRKSLEKETNFDHKSISPYNIESFEEIMHLASQRNLLNIIWAKFKYRDWKLKKYNSEDNEIFCFIPESKEEYRIEHIAINRYLYRDHINLQKMNAKKFVENKKSINHLIGISENINITKWVEDLFNLQKKDFFKASTYIRNLLVAQKESLESEYLDIEHDGISVSEIFLGFEYLFTIADIYQKAALKDFNQDNIDDYKKLSPIIDVSHFINHFQGLFGLERTKSEKILKLFTFSNSSKLDVFSQPLIYCGSNKVVFCPTLILQMNVVRIIELLITEWNIDISQKGTEFEKKLRFVLSFNPYINVNTNKVAFEAYDGRGVEFDFLGTFEDFLLLIEFKNLKIPYSDKMMKNAEDTINFGIEQVNRRVDVLRYNWEQVRELCSFELPDKPFDENKIIKIVCSNIFNFTTLIKNGVRVVDSSSLLKFFMNPEVKAISVGEKVEEIANRKLWKTTYPTITEFQAFLKCPIAIEPYNGCFEGVPKPIPKIEDDDFNIAFFDYSMTKDPYEIYFNDTFPKQQVVNEREIGRNEKCPCLSGKKYKKCCGR